MKKPKPFFAKFLENQMTGREMSGMKAGCPGDPDNMTLKQPSDQEEALLTTNGSFQDVAEEVSDPFVLTMKLPSDTEEL